MTQEIVKQGARLPIGLQNAIAMWADSTTDAASSRRLDLLRDKGRALEGFFSYTGKPPGLVTSIDIKTWQAHIEGQGLSPATVYAKVSRVSSFFKWAMKEDRLEIRANPVNLARPKAPKAYQTESTQALDDGEVVALLAVVKARGDVVGKRDYALLLMYLATGLRRSEVIRLRWRDIKVNGGLVLTSKVKGGDYREREVRDPRVARALLDYLEASGRQMQPDSPLWVRHDRAGKPGSQLTSHAFVKNLKRYAEQAGIGDIHLHQTRHTFARMVAEDSGSIKEVQEALDHENEATTKVYVQRVVVKKDKYSTSILDRLEV